MLDDLRNQTSFEPGEEDNSDLFADAKKKKPKPKKERKPARSLDQITGLKAPQRFLIALMLLLVVCLLGSILLILTGKVVPPVTF